MPRLAVEIWSDIACPWCFVGKRRFEAALAQFPHRDEVAVTWRAFELDPTAPRGGATDEPIAQRLASKYGMPVAKAEAMLQSTTETAAAAGAEIHFDRVRSGNTFDAHRVLAFAAARGLDDVAHERLFKAYFTDGEAVSDPATLTRLAVELGLDPGETAAVLAGDAYTPEVRRDQAEAKTLGIRGVPFFVVDRRYGVSGAQPPEALLEVLTQAWAELPEAAADPTAAPMVEGAACGPDGC